MRCEASSRLLLIGLSFVVLTTTGCLTLTPPDGFLVVEQSRDEFRAVSSDEAKLWVREFKDRLQGDYGFWVDALKNDFEENRGYTLLSEQEVTDDKGRTGLELLIEVTADGGPQRYLITVFVREGMFSNTIRVAEFVAAKTVFDEHLEGVRSAVRSLRP